MLDGGWLFWSIDEANIIIKMGTNLISTFVIKFAYIYQDMFIYILINLHNNLNINKDNELCVTPLKNNKLSPKSNIIILT